jgi:hypothetical protein
MLNLTVNHQTEIARRFHVTEAYHQEISKIALYKIFSWNKIYHAIPASPDFREELSNMISEAFFYYVPNSFVLSEEGFYFHPQEN